MDLTPYHFLLLSPAIYQLTLGSLRLYFLDRRETPLANVNGSASYGASSSTTTSSIKPPPRYSPLGRKIAKLCKKASRFLVYICIIDLVVLVFPQPFKGESVDYFLLALSIANFVSWFLTSYLTQREKKKKTRYSWINRGFWVWSYIAANVQLYLLITHFAHKDVTKDIFKDTSIVYFAVFATRYLLNTFMGISGIILPFLKFTHGSRTERSSLLHNATSDSDDDVEEGIYVPRLKSNVPQGKIRKFYQRVKLLLPFLWPSDNLYLQFMIVMCILLLMLGNVVNFLVPRGFKDVVDSLGGDDKSTPYFAWDRILYFVFLRFLQGSVGLISSTQKIFWIPVGQYTTKAISVKMFKHLHNLSLRFHINRKTGEVLRVQDRGVASIVSLLNSLFFNIVPTLVDIGVACAYLTYHFDIYFGSIVFVTMGMYILSTIIITDWRTKYRRLANTLDNAMEAKAVDSLLNFETVKYYNAEDYEVAQYTEAVDAYQHADWMNNFTLSLLNTTQNTIIQVGLLVGCLLCAKRVVNREMTIGDFVLYLTYITQLYGPLNWFGSYYRLIQKNFIDMECLLELFQEPIEVRDLPDAQALVVKKGDVVFENVSFSYDDKVNILKNISFKISHGSTVALVGPSGSGKSTLLRLLFRFYDVQSGRILIDGQDIRHVKQKDLRRHIGVVPQDTVLFNDDIRYNIRYGKVNATEKEVETAASAARIHNKIIAFPDGYDTRVGERGLRLSGGEKQRVAIARTILKDPPIVLLDEATSALDTNTERHIQAALKSMTKNRTTLVIAHRLSTIVHADMILVVRDGEIVERGSHAELMSQCDGVYYDLWMKQLQDDEKMREDVLQQLEDLGTSESDMEGSTSSAVEQKKM